MTMNNKSDITAYGIPGFSTEGEVCFRENLTSQVTCKISNRTVSYCKQLYPND